MQDAQSESNGLFYLHFFLESHYPFLNPYTETPAVNRTGVLYEDVESGVKIDYVKQRMDSMHYIDDTLTPFLEKLQCPMVLFGDHGNIVENEPGLKQIELEKQTFHEDLIQIPLFIKAPNTPIKEDSRLISLMEINKIIISLLNGTTYEYEEKEFVKVARSEIYNQVFRDVLKKAGKEQAIWAFEAFIFREGYKLAIFANGVIMLYDRDTDKEIIDDRLKGKLLDRVKDFVTVCDLK